MAIDHTSDMTWVPFTISPTGRDSQPIEGKGKGVAAILVLGNYTASSLGFMSQVEKDGTFYDEYLDDGTQMGLTQANAVAGRIIRLAPDACGVGFRHKFRVHTANAQAAGVTGFLLMRGF